LLSPGGLMGGHPGRQGGPLGGDTGLLSPGRVVVVVGLGAVVVTPRPELVAGAWGPGGLPDGGPGAGQTGDDATADSMVPVIARLATASVSNPIDAKAATRMREPRMDFLLASSSVLAQRRPQCLP
jgi:hypothetical protein